MVQGRLVNGSLGVVKDFISVGDALRLGVDLVSDASKVEKSKSHHTKDARADALQQHSRRLLMAERRRSGEAYLGFIAIKQAVGFSRDQKWPLVVFENGLKLLCTPLEFEGYGFMGNVEVVRLPVCLCPSRTLCTDCPPYRCHSRWHGPFPSTRLKASL
jgi:hypothetical protein